MKEVFNNRIKGVCMLIIFLSIFVSIGSLIINYYFDFEKPISAADTSQASISLTVEETPATNPTPAAGGGVSTSGGGGGGSGAGGGGGGGAVIRVIPDFSVDQVLIKVSSQIGETFKKSVTITNPNGKVLKFNVVTSLESMVYISEKEFEIPAYGEKTIFLTFVANDHLEPDVYTGKLVINSQYTEKQIPVVYEVRTKNSLFDVSLNIPAEYKRLTPGEDLFFQVTLLNLAQIGNVSVEMQYSIKDFEGNIVKSFNETVAVEKQVTFSKSVSLPGNLKLGDYVIAVKAKYGLGVGTASDVFSVVDINEISLSPQYQRFFLWGIIIIIIILLIIIYQLRKMRLKNIAARQKKELSRIDEKVNNKEISAQEISSQLGKLKTQCSLLEEAYKKEYITKNSYEEGKTKINALITKLKKRL